MLMNFHELRFQMFTDLFWTHILIINMQASMLASNTLIKYRAFKLPASHSVGPTRPAKTPRPGEAQTPQERWRCPVVSDTKVLAAAPGGILRVIWRF